jgi:hypothetical protein
MGTNAMAPPMESWPIAGEARRVDRAMYAGVTPLDELNTRVHRLLDAEEDGSSELKIGVRPPSFEELGILAALAGHIEEQIACATQYLDSIRSLMKAGQSAMSIRPEAS